MLLRLLLVFFSTFFLALPNHGGTCTQSEPIPHAIRTNPLPCQKKVVILHSHSALGSHSRYRSTKSAGDQGLCSPQKIRDFRGPQERCIANESLFPGQRLAALRISSSPRNHHDCSTLPPRSVCSACVIVVFY